MGQRSQIYVRETVGDMVVCKSSEEFDSEAEAQADADDLIISELSAEYEIAVNCFEVIIEEK